MTRLSTDQFAVNLAGPRYGEWVTFTVFARVVPSLAYGRRFEYVRNLEKIANRVEDDLKNISNGSYGPYINVVGPVMFTHQFAQKPSRLTFTGFMQSGTPVLSPLTPRTIEHDNQIMTGPSSTGGTLRDDAAPTVDENNDVRLLKQVVENAAPDLAGNVFRIELNGVLYGDNGRSFPI